MANLDAKVRMGMHLAQDMQHADQLRRRLASIDRAFPRPRRPRAGWKAAMQAVDFADGEGILIRCLYLCIKPRLVALYERYLLHSDPLGDAKTRSAITVILQEKRDQVAWAREFLPSVPPANAAEIVLARLDGLWNGRHAGHWLGENEGLWPPVDRVPRVARPDGMRRGEPGALRVIPKDPFRTRQDIGIFLHSFLNEEITTMELVARNTYEHPEMPWDFHLDMARHAGDEARHAAMVASAAGDHGVTYGDYPIYVSSYEGQYEFMPCEPGSQHELLWRILLRQTFHEGLALDSLAYEVTKRRYLGQEALTRLFSFLLADEIFHAESGQRWGRYLCGGDDDLLLKERAIAHDYFVQMVKETRARYVAYNIEAAVAEVEYLETVQHEQFPMQRSLNLHARREAGFSEQDIQQIVDWGYVRLAADMVQDASPVHPAGDTRSGDR